MATWQLPSLPAQRHENGSKHCSSLRRWNASIWRPMSSLTTPPFRPCRSFGRFGYLSNALNCALKKMQKKKNTCQKVHLFFLTMETCFVLVLNLKGQLGCAMSSGRVLVVCMYVLVTCSIPKVARNKIFGDDLCSKIAKLLKLWHYCSTFCYALPHDSPM